MTETDALLRELVAETRVQTVYLESMDAKMDRNATKDDIDNAGKLMERESRSRRAEHKAILAKAGNGTKDKLLLLSFVVLAVLAGATSAVALWMRALGG